ncbi:MAG: ADP-ribosylglycohydrolase family protein [Pirellulaceae bacterium]|nr:ADP-ribosylglycohydrolase family protein [Pirellulaceae bacterium]
MAEQNDNPIMLDSVVGCILGTAVGDAIGLPYEGLSRQRAARLLGPPNRHRFFFGRGMVSDDTEHTCMVAQALIVANGDVQEFQRSLAWGLRWWLLGVPAGVGLATSRAIVRLWLGYSPDRSGVYSAGNGPAMRAAILGVVISDVTQLRQFVRVSSRLTHTDPKAELGAFAVAVAAHMAASHEVVDPDHYLDWLSELIGQEDSELLQLIGRVVASVNAKESTAAFAESMGLTKGVSGYVYHTVPIAIHAWLTHQHDCRAAIMSIVQCGGDADSTAAIVGGIVGAGVGQKGIPADWLDGLIEWPRTVSWMENLGEQVGRVYLKEWQSLSRASNESHRSRTKKGQMTLEDFRNHIRKILNPGLLQRLVMLLPGIPVESRNRIKQITGSEEGCKAIKRQISMIDAMTPEERRDPHKIDAIRMQHLASELGVRTGEIIGLIRQFDALSSMLQMMATGSPPRLPVIGVLVRNLFFILVVLLHGFRRLGPPYGPR